jgi:phosphate transport system substrate-binding protein
VACFFGSSGTAFADPVELVLRDGSFSVSGTLTSYDGEIYQIQSEFGPLTLAAEMVVCRGATCPTLSASAENVTFSGDASLNSALLMPLIQSFAKHQGYSYQLSQELAGQITLLDPNNGEARAVFTLSDRNSGEAILDILNDQAHFALTLRDATPEEQAALKKDMFGALDHPQNSLVVGWQDLYLYSQPSNPNRFITMSQLVAMLGEKPGLWPLAAGRQYPAILTGQEDQTLALKQLLRVVDDIRPMPPKGVHTPGRLTVSTDQMTQDTLVQVSLGCGPQVMPAEIQTLAHPLQTPIYLIAAPKKMQSISRAFWAFLLTPEAQDAVQRLGFTSRSPEKTEIHGQSGLLINAILNTDMDMRT